MRKEPLKICINCAHCDKSQHFLACNAPQLGKNKGQSCKMMRERFDSAFQEETYKKMFKEICGREGLWYQNR